MPKQSIEIIGPLYHGSFVVALLAALLETFVGPIRGTLSHVLGSCRLLYSNPKPKTQNPKLPSSVL